MKIWPTVRDEFRGAWRSMRYDLTRQPLTRRSGSAGPRQVGVAGPELVPADYDPYEGGPRRVIVSAGVAALIMGGALGSYFGVVNGLGALLDRPPAPGGLPTTTGDEVTALGTAAPGKGSRARDGRPVAAAPDGDATPTPSPSASRAVGRATVSPPVPTEAVPAEPAEPAEPVEPVEPGVPVPTPAPSYSGGASPTPTPTAPGPWDSTPPVPDPSDPSAPGHPDESPYAPHAAEAGHTGYPDHAGYPDHTRSFGDARYPDHTRSFGDARYPDHARCLGDGHYPSNEGRWQ